MKAVAPWVSIRFISIRMEVWGFFYIMGAHRVWAASHS